MDKCNICNNKISLFSKKNFIDKSKKYNWENDSTVELAGLESTNASLGYCKKCLHTSIFPRFDTDRLYNGNAGFEARKKAFEYHNPDSEYGSNRNLTSSKKNAKRIEREFIRISNITNKIVKISNDFDKSNKKSISILDYGGGDGYLVKIIKEILESKTNFNFDFKVETSLYDPAYENNISNVKPDIIIISHVLEHIHDLEKFFKKLSKITDDDTQFIIEVPDERLKILKNIIFQSKVYFNFHVNIFTVRSLAVLFDSNGFNSDFSYTNVFYRGVRTNVINGIAGKKIRNSTSFNMYEIFSFFNLIVSKIKIKLLNF